jgi:hypothetical protein
VQGVPGAPNWFSGYGSVGVGCWRVRLTELGQGCWHRASANRAYSLIPDRVFGLFLWLLFPSSCFLRPQGLQFFQTPAFRTVSRHFPIFNPHPRTISPIIRVRIENAFHHLVLPCMRSNLRDCRTHPARSNPPRFQTSLQWRVHCQV